ncbi:MAG: hypothetical protein GY778_01910 [bacterium]|nr:hypothetical protein [bacterium]
MMVLEYEQSLVEAAVFLAIRRDEQLECAFHLAVDPLYEIPDPERRQLAFVPVFRDYFARLRLGRAIDDLMAERPLIGRHVGRCIVREAAREKAESAELFVRGTDDDPETEGDRTAPARTVVVQACPHSLLGSERFVGHLRRELLHIADMLDERFGYRPESFSGPRSLQNLQRDRYRTLWDVFIESRLDREGSSNAGIKTRLQRAFRRVFPGEAAGQGSAAFGQIYGARQLTHRQLMSWARDPGLLFVSQDGALPMSAPAKESEPHAAIR